jgi:hypothetical protein
VSIELERQIGEVAVVHFRAASENVAAMTPT